MAIPAEDEQDDQNENNDNPPSLEELGVHPHITPYLIGLCLVALIWYNVSSNLPMINNLVQNLHNQLAGISTAAQIDLLNMTENLSTDTTSWQHNKFSLESDDELKFDIHINLDLTRKLPNKNSDCPVSKDKVETKTSKMRLKVEGDVSNNLNNSLETSNPQQVCSEPQHLMEEPGKQETGDETSTEVHSSGPEMPTPPNVPAPQVAEKKEEQEPVDRKEKSGSSTSSGQPQQEPATMSPEMPPPPNVPMFPEAEKREEQETVDRKENKPSKEQVHPPG